MPYHLTARSCAALLVVLSLALLSGCFSEERDLSFQICSDFDVPEDLQALRISVLDVERNTLHVTLHELLICPDDRVRLLPQTIQFLDAHPDAALVTVAGLQDDVVVVRTERRLDDRNRVTINLPRSCQGVQCSQGQACISGACQWTPTGTDISCMRSAEPDPANEVEEEQEEQEEDDEEPNGNEEPQEPGPTYCPPEES